MAVWESGKEGLISEAEQAGGVLFWLSAEAAAPGLGSPVFGAHSMVLSPGSSGEEMETEEAGEGRASLWAWRLQHLFLSLLFFQNPSPEVGVASLDRNHKNSWWQPCLTPLSPMDWCPI